jgi:hypothetical protein
MDQRVAQMAFLPQGTQCAAVPDASSLTSFDYFTETDLQDAAGLNLSFAGIGANGAYSKTSDVVAFRAGQTAECPSTDGKFTLVYGAEWDAGMVISQDSISGKASFASLAANATISGSSDSFDFSSSGFKDPTAINAASAKMSSDVFANGLTVTNFGTFATDFTTGVTAVAQATPITPLVLIGYRPTGTADVTNAVLLVYALPYIAQGRGCLDAINSYPVKSMPNIDAEVRAAYLALSGGVSDCSASDPSMQALANQYLTGMRIAPPPK